MFEPVVFIDGYVKLEVECIRCKILFTIRVISGDMIQTELLFSQAQQVLRKLEQKQSIELLGLEGEIISFTPLNDNYLAIDIKGRSKEDGFVLTPEQAQEVMKLCGKAP
ncbi:hypothetical protein [Bacillus sp. XF8]|uniref:hypothetical protein n=1 Tax=Bacillus sp. XF8 TaxID=2819289 RepID=UPI001AA05CE7|nr:hypothetical protein [Bacillus sp. XF8]MBO1579370.1 hypothetical protein [Bacillus sp. XF8]